VLYNMAADVLRLKIFT